MKKNTCLKLMIIVFLSFALLVLVNLFARKFNRSFNLYSQEVKLIDDRVIGAIGDANSRITVYIALLENSPEYAIINKIVNYMQSHSENGVFEIVPLDIYTHTMRISDIAERAHVPNFAVVMEYEGRYFAISQDELYSVTDFDRLNLSKNAQQLEFNCLRTLSQGVLHLLATKKNNVYYITGHGEREFSDYDVVDGYSTFAREIVREGYNLLPWNMANVSDVPEDASCLIVLGPCRNIDDESAMALLEFVKNGGPMLLLIDNNASLMGGWNKLLTGLGLKSSHTVATDPRMRNLGTGIWGKHLPNISITKNLSMDSLYFVNPLIFEVIPPKNNSYDPVPKPIVVASNDAWGEANLDSYPRHYDADLDKKDGLFLAMLVETYAARDLERNMMRAIVIGDPNFAKNSLLASGTSSNCDFLMSSLNWLMDEKIAYRADRTLNSTNFRLIPQQSQIAIWVKCVLIVPFCIAIFGLLMTYLRKVTR